MVASVTQKAQLSITDPVQAVVKDDSFYGLLVSQHIFKLLEERSAVMADQEIPVMNRMPVAVDRSFKKFDQWEKVTDQDEWTKRAYAS